MLFASFSINLKGSLRSCPLPIIPLCLSREGGVIFFPSPTEEAKKQKKNKKITPDLRLPQGQWKIMKSIISSKSIKSIALTTKKVVVIDFYRLTVSVDINENLIIDNYRIIDWFSDICFYRLHPSGRVGTEQVIVGRGWLEIWQFFFCLALWSGTTFSK